MKASEIVEKFVLMPTPIPLLNDLLAGGIPSKVITEIAGPPGVGKSTLALQLIAQAQRMGKKTYYADAERSVEFVKFASGFGVDCSLLEYDKQMYAEELLENLRQWAIANKGGFIVLDSVGSLTTKEEIEKPMEGRTIGVQARTIAKFCRVLRHVSDENNNWLIMVNHIYTDASSGAIRSSGGEKLSYEKGLSLWLRPSYGKQARKSSNGIKNVVFVDAEIRSKAKYPLAMVGRKETLEFIPKQGFVGEFVSAPVIKRGRPKVELRP